MKMMSQQQISTVGVVGSYPNGGFPSQAFYGVQGFPTPAQAQGQSQMDVIPGKDTLVTTTATILALLVGGYILWHATR